MTGLSKLRTLPDRSVHCCVTSPPYWGLRDYSRCGCVQRRKESTSTLVGSQGGFDPHHESIADPNCPHCGGTGTNKEVARGQLGLEKTPEEYVAKLVAGFCEVWRVLRDNGTLWLNLGDSYGGGNKKQKSNRGANGQVANLSKNVSAIPGLKPKDIVGIPWRVAFALQSDGWYLRSDIIWAKKNTMPESVTDRPTKSHEYIFLLSKQARYFYDASAILEPCSESTHARISQDLQNQVGTFRANGGQKTNRAFKPSVRKLAESGSGIKSNDSFVSATLMPVSARNKRDVWFVGTEPYSEAHFATFPTDLIKPCVLAGCPVGETVLDPFAGSGTTGQVAMELGRNAILIELNPKYVELIKQRTFVTPGMPLDTPPRKPTLATPTTPLLPLGAK